MQQRASIGHAHQHQIASGIGVDAQVVVLGLNGVVIKSHGGTDEVGYKAALGLGYEMARSRVLDKIRDGMRRFPTLSAEAPGAPAAENEAKPA